MKVQSVVEFNRLMRLSSICCMIICAVILLYIETSNYFFTSSPSLHPLDVGIIESIKNNVGADTPPRFIHLVKQRIDTSQTPSLEIPKVIEDEQLQQSNSYSWLWRSSKLMKASFSPSSSSSSSSSASSSPLYYKEQQFNQYLVQFRDTITDDVRSRLEMVLGEVEGAKILFYIPDDSFHVVMTAQQADKLKRRLWVSWIGVYDAHHKVHMSTFGDNARSLARDHPSSSVLIQLVENRVFNTREAVDALVGMWTEKINLHLASKKAKITIVIPDPPIPYSTSIQSPRFVPKLISKVECIPHQQKHHHHHQQQEQCDIDDSEKLAYDWISNQVESLYIERIQVHQTSNKYVPTVMFSHINGSLLDPNDLASIPLRGKGQIIGCSDTGIDMSHCFFIDVTQPAPSSTVNLNHRKVVALFNYQNDNTDVADGHGTHVAGSMVGVTSNLPDTINEYRGTAFDAKLAFADISNNNGPPTPPSNIGDMYQAIYDTGARVQGDSWGSVSVNGYDGTYSTSSSDIDGFIYSHQDFLICRAAGNNGQSMSLLTQGVSKNVLTVGAQSSRYDSFTPAATTYKSYEDDRNAGAQFACNFDQSYCNYTDAQCCVDQNTVRGLGDCCIATIKNQYLSSIATPQGKAQLNENNIASFSSRGPTHDGRIKPDIVAPGSYVVSSRSNGADNTNQCVSGVPLDSLFALQGTSMATPHVAGAVAILRQYLTEGYYPTGEATASNSFKSPTASLMKAIVINSATRLNGTMNVPVDSSPTGLSPIPANGYVEGASYVDGWGAIKLGNILDFKSQPNPLKPWIGISGLESNQSIPDWKEPELSTNKSISYCVRFVSKGASAVGDPQIKATLVWTDPPSAPSAFYNLVNNLDLRVQYENIIQFGNQGQESVKIVGALPDSINNVEQITIKPTVGGTIYKYTITGKSVPIGPQKFSFVVSGINGEYEWSYCPQCGPNDVGLCTVPNGEGTQVCNPKTLLWERCVVNSCASGYNYNSLTNSCSAFLSYNYVVIIVAGATMILLFFIIGLIKYMERKEKKNRKEDIESLKSHDDSDDESDREDDSDDENDDKKKKHTTASSELGTTDNGTSINEKTMGDGDNSNGGGNHNGNIGEGNNAIIVGSGAAAGAAEKSKKKRKSEVRRIHVRPKTEKDKVTIPDLYSLLSPFIFRLLISAACSLISTAAAILQPFYIGNIIQAIPTTTSINDLREQFIYIFLLALVEFIFTTISSWVSGIVNELMNLSLQVKVFKTIMLQEMGFFSRNNAPTLINVLIIDTPMLRSALTGILLTFATGICKFVGSLVFLFSISWKLSLAFFATIPILAITTKVQSQFAKRLTRQLLFFTSKLSKTGSEAMVNIQVVLNYNRQESEIKKFDNSAMDVFQTARSLIVVNTFAGSVKWFLVETLAFIILYFGAYLSIKKEFSVGLLVSFTLYVGYVIDSSQSLFGIYISYVQSLASAHRVFLILRNVPRRRKEKYIDPSQITDGETPGAGGNGTIISSTTPSLAGQSPATLVGESPTPAVLPPPADGDTPEAPKPTSKKEQKRLDKEKEKAIYKETGIAIVEMQELPSTFVKLKSVKGDIEFKNVTFRYPTRPDVVVLNDINLKLERGKCYGLVGPSGSGKSTCLELMANFYQINQGEIKLDGHSTKMISPIDLRKFITVVNQQAFLFDSTIAENIGYALDNPTREEIIEASKMANAHEFIVDLPLGYDTQLGQAGSMLSGGQKKRIAIARAICAKRTIMLLDEITAELDPESEEAITNSIKKLTQGHTVVIVAHKIAAVRDCDKIFVLEKGCLVEEGTHTQLMEMRGRYYRMFSNPDDSDLALPSTDPNNNDNNNNNINSNSDGSS